MAASCVVCSSRVVPGCRHPRKQLGSPAGPAVAHQLAQRYSVAVQPTPCHLHTCTCLKHFPLPCATQVATDNSGLGAAWHLEYVEVTDLMRGTAVVFPCNRWFDAKVGGPQAARSRANKWLQPAEPELFGHDGATYPGRIYPESAFSIGCLPLIPAV